MKQVLQHLRTGDIGVAGPTACTCGRHYRLLATVEGRQQEYIITADGRAIALTGLVFGRHWRAFAKIRQLQLVQREPGSVLLRIAKDPTFAKEDEREILEKINGALGSGLHVVLDYVERIPLTPRASICSSSSLCLYPPPGPVKSGSPSFSRGPHLVLVFSVSRHTSYGSSWITCAPRTYATKCFAQ